jgi:RimJ/RimL family protein N-acetyltransferase
MKLIELDARGLEVAIGLYREGLDWAVTSQLHTNSDDVAKSAFVSPGAIWRLAVGEQSGECIGLCGFENISPLDGVCEPYVAVSVKRRGRGFEMGKVWCDFAFNVMNMRRIQSTVLFDAPSRKLLEKLEFKLEGTHRGMRFRNGEYVDTVTYALIKE